MHQIRPFSVVRCALSFALCFCCGIALQAQQDTLSELKIGQWEQHLPWQRVRYVTGSDSKIYCATEWAVVEIDKADRSPRFITKVEGLSDIGMGAIRYNRAANVLLLTYSNSNIDLWRPDGSVTNLPFIKKNVGLSGDKKIYDIYFDGKNAYLSCGFGLVKLNLEREEVEYTVFTGIPVRAFSIFNGQLYAGTEEGLYRLPADDQNPADFGRWKLMGDLDGFPGVYTVSALAVFENMLFMGVGKEVYRYNGSGLELTAKDDNFEVIYLTTEGKGLVAGFRKNFSGRVVYRAPGGQQSDIQYGCDTGRPIYCVEDGEKVFWFADESDGFHVWDGNTGICDRFSFNSPKTHRNTEIALARGQVFVATPGPPTQLEPIYGQDGIMILKDGQWSQISKQTTPDLLQGDCWADLWRVTPHPDEDRFYGGSWVGGLVEVSGSTVKCYTQNNSVLMGAGASGTNRTAIGGSAFDQDGNLWISNYDASSPIAVLKADGSIVNFSAAPANNLLQVVVDQNGYKWYIIAFNGGVLVYDSGANLDSPDDDRYRVITSSNSVMESNNVGSIAVDLEGDVWVGTQQGVVSFECGSNVFDPSCKGSRRIVEVDGFNEYLLKTEDVRAIAIDGANRKWFGTTNGIFVQSPNGETQVARFTDTNSPLFDNNITSIAINPVNGETWIGTEKGIQTIRSEATVGGKFNTPTAYAYPNPVRADYDGPIAIYGLARDANIKITDVAGNLVYEGKALGGQAVWDGRDYNGRRAASGVYLIMATSEESFDTPDTIIVKVVLLN